MKHFIKNFSELSTLEFYQIVKERIAIFVVEQDCPYQEVDEIDLIAWHNFYVAGAEVVAYNRIYQEKTVHIGRVIVKESQRGTGLGLELMESAIAFAEEKFPGEIIEISAQAHLQHFYGKVGFVTTSDVYLEDDIPHVTMRRAVQ